VTEPTRRGVSKPLLYARQHAAQPGD
jgi:hypothetical protein